LNKLQVLAALGVAFFEHVFPDIIRNCSHQKASVRDGYLTLFKVKQLKWIFILIYNFLRLFFREDCLINFPNILVSATVIRSPVPKLSSPGAACNLRWYDTFLFWAW
jgi:hypothetical protein